MALTTNSQTNAYGVSNRAVGQVVTDAGAAADTTFTLGFAPRYIAFVNRTDRITLEWYEGMAANTALRTVAAGTRTLDVSAGITVVGRTFKVLAADIPASKSISYVAEA